MTLILFNKPFNVLCQFTPEPNGPERPTLKDYIDVPGVYPAGRLDTDSEGLLLLTDDGRLQARIADPRFKMPKTYLAQVEGEPDEAALDTLRRGVTLKDGRTLPAEVERIDDPAVPQDGQRLLDQPDHPRGQEPPGAPHDCGGGTSHAQTGALADRGLDA